jgi:hypothetical protein
MEMWNARCTGLEPKPNDTLTDHDRQSDDLDCAAVLAMTRYPVEQRLARCTCDAFGEPAEDCPEDCGCDSYEEQCSCESDCPIHQDCSDDCDDCGCDNY